MIKIKNIDWKECRLFFILIALNIIFIVVILLLTALEKAYVWIISVIPASLKEAAPIFLWVTAGLLTIAFITMGFYKIVKLFRLSVDVTGMSTDDLYNDVCEVCYKAVDETLCEKIGIDPVESHEDLKRVNSPYKAVDGVMLFYVEYSKGDVKPADLARLEAL